MALIWPYVHGKHIIFHVYKQHFIKYDISSYIYIYLYHITISRTKLLKARKSILTNVNSTITGLSMKGQWDFKGIKPVFFNIKGNWKI